MCICPMISICINKMVCVFIFSITSMPTVCQRPRNTAVLCSSFQLCSPGYSQPCYIHVCIVCINCCFAITLTSHSVQSQILVHYIVKWRICVCTEWLVNVIAKQCSWIFSTTCTHVHHRLQTKILAVEGFGLTEKNGLIVVMCRESVLNTEVLWLVNCPEKFKTSCRMHKNTFCALCIVITSQEHHSNLRTVRVCLLVASQMCH